MAQLNLIDGSVSGTTGGSGGWLDAAYQAGRMLHSAGLFRVDPNLSWGTQPIVSDAQGGYYRNSYQSRRWQTELGVDYLDSISGRGASTTYYSGSARFQVSRDFGVGGVANVRESSGEHGWSTQGYVDWRNRLGISRAQLNYAEDSPRHDAALTLDQSWQMPQHPPQHLAFGRALDRHRHRGSHRAGLVGLRRRRPDGAPVHRRQRALGARGRGQQRARDGRQRRS